MSKGSIWAIVISAVLFLLTVGYVCAVFITAEISFDNTSFETETVEVFGEYEDQEEYATVMFPLFFNRMMSGSVYCQSEVQPDKVGEYTVTYMASFLNKTVTAERTVKVVDTVSPVVEVEENFFEIDADLRPVSPEAVSVAFSAKDNYDGDITENVEKIVENDICYIKATDSSGNTAQAEIKIIYKDSRGPSLKLKGNSTVYMPVNTEYKEYGFTVNDNYDTNIASKVVITSTVDMSQRGTYAVTYSVADEAGNQTSVTRKVIVYGGGYDPKFDTVIPNGRVIYLTFDDGPGPYTERLLEILQSYKVKSTFFVTNQFPKYQDLIGRMHREGHTVAIHTLTHKWDIYKSIDAYLADFNAMNDIVEKQTGSKTNIFRFPGGTNNTVSRSQCKGIMTDLSRYMLENGYLYFDWNVSTDDDRLKDPSDIITTLISQIADKENSMVLAHDIKNGTVEAMPGFIEYCLKNGYRFEVIKEDTEPMRTNPRN